MRLKFFCSLLAFALLSVTFCHAQRQTPGRPSLDLYASFGTASAVPAGGGFFWCNYDYSGRTCLGLDVFREWHGYTEPAIITGGKEVAPEENYEFVSTDICASVGYMFRVLAPRSRFFILSAGGHALVGIKYLPDMSSFMKSDDKAYSSVGFYLGVVPEVQMELFPFRNVSLYGSVRPRARAISSMGGRDRWFNLSFAGGVKIYL